MTSVNVNSFSFSYFCNMFNNVNTEIIEKQLKGLKKISEKTLCNVHTSLCGL